MKLLKQLFPALAAVAVTLVMAPAQAAGTAAGVAVDNQASVAYSVGGVAQAAELSNTDSFRVDRKIDLVVAEVGGAYTFPAAGEQNSVTTFTLTNTGNETQDFLLSAVEQASTTTSPHNGAESDNTDFGGTVQIFVDNPGAGGTAGVYDAAFDTATYVDELAADGQVTVFILADVPAGEPDGNIALFSLVGQAADAVSNDFATTGVTYAGENGGAGNVGTASVATGLTTADTQGAVDTVFADAAGDTDAQYDGRHSDTDAYKVRTATIVVTKSSRVITDPFNCTTDNDPASCGTNVPKRVPGAVIEYCVEVQNTGAADATSVVISDDLVGDPVSFLATAYTTAGPITGGIMTASTACTANDGLAEDDNTTDADETDPNGGSRSGTVITGNFPTVTAGTTSRMQFRVTIN